MPSDRKIEKKTNKRNLYHENAFNYGKIKHGGAAPSTGLKKENLKSRSNASGKKNLEDDARQRNGKRKKEEKESRRVDKTFACEFKTEQ